tara:strand:+ start:24 stop:371 length:348 start_codon:yes stop_codon:yes gene_type:complete
MANRSFKDVQALGNETKIIAFTLSALNGSPVATPSIGVASVGISTGDVTITLDDKYNGLLCAQVGIGSLGAISNAEVKSEDVNGAKTVVIDTTGSPDANDRLHVTLFLRNSSYTV